MRHLRALDLRRLPSARLCADSLGLDGGLQRCGTAYADEQRRGVLDDGDGEVVCHRCGSRFRLRRLDLVEADVAEALLAEVQPCACGNKVRARQLFVLHDRWVGRTTSQNLYHLLCACGVTLASHASRPERE